MAILMMTRAAAVLLSLLATPSAAQLLVQPCSAVGASWPDHGSGSAHDVTIYTPAGACAPAAYGYLALGSYAQIGYEDAGTFKGWQQPYGPVMAVREVGAPLGVLGAAHVRGAGSKQVGGR